MKIIFCCIMSRRKYKVSSSSTESASVMSLNFLAKMTTWKCNIKFIHAVHELHKNRVSKYNHYCFNERSNVPFEYISVVL